MSEVYPVVAELGEAGFDLKVVCKVLEVSRSGYYAFRKDGQSVRRREDERLKPLIKETFLSHRRRYGKRRVMEELQALGESCGRDKTARIMREMELFAIQPRSFKPRTTNSRHKLGYNENLLRDLAHPTELNRVWVGDITYLPLVKGWCYLAMLMDLCSRRIVGWALENHMRESLVRNALQEAIACRQPPSGLIHHTDRGGQYAGKKYREILTRAEMKQSMSGAGDCYDNAFMESYFGTLKTELELTAYESIEQARREISEYINYYDTRRRHSGIDYLSPMEFERQHLTHPR